MPGVIAVIVIAVIVFASERNLRNYCHLLIPTIFGPRLFFAGRITILNETQHRTLRLYHTESGKRLSCLLLPCHLMFPG